MELRHLRYFLAVAGESSFTRAAAKLGIGQPPLSQQIKDLEQELGTVLFHRTPHGVELSEAGTAFMEEAQLVLAGAERARTAAQRAGRGESGQLRVGFTGSAAFNPIVPTMIRNFRRAWPRVHLSLEEANTMRLLEALATSKLDALFIRPGLAGLKDVRLCRFADEPMKVVLPAGHRLAKRKRLPLSALAQEPFVLFPRAVGLSLYDEIVNACRKAGFEPLLNQEAPQISSVVNLVAAEMGVSIVPAAISQVQVEGVRYLDIESEGRGTAPLARLALATREQERSAIVRNFAGLALPFAAA